MKPPKPRGKYRWIAWNSDEGVFYAKSDHYGIRRKRGSLQIKVKFLGSLIWINIDESDLVEAPTKER